jgi:hypothetical protein
MALHVSVNCLFDVRNSHSQPQLAQDMMRMEMMKLSLAWVGCPVVVCWQGSYSIVDIRFVRINPLQNRHQINNLHLHVTPSYNRQFEIKDTTDQVFYGPVYFLGVN